MKISLIVAMSDNRVIGKGGDLPWRLSDDLKRFKAITMGHPILMGRKTFESIGKPLPGRHNLVISRNRSYSAEGATVARSLQEALKIFYNEGRGKEEIFIIGGAEIFQAALPIVDRVYLTRVHGEFQGDVFFPDVDFEKNFALKEKTAPKKEKNLTFEYLIYDRTAEKAPLNLDD